MRVSHNNFGTIKMTIVLTVKLLNKLTSEK